MPSICNVSVHWWIILLYDNFSMNVSSCYWNPDYIYVFYLQIRGKRVNMYVWKALKYTTEQELNKTEQKTVKYITVDLNRFM